MFDDLVDLYQQVILDHCKTPRNFRKLEGANRVAQGHNPLCGDQLHDLRADGRRRRQRPRFQGSGCAISKSSASLLTEALKGKTKSEVKALFDKVHEMVTSGKSMRAVWANWPFLREFTSSPRG